MGSTARESSSAGPPAAAPPAQLESFQHRGWTAELGLEFERASSSEVAAAWTVADRHLQPHGLVHGGVYASVVETCCSVGAALAAPEGKQVVGMENHTSFLRPVKSGRLRAVAVPVQLGLRVQLWRCDVRDERDRLVATGQVRLLAVDRSSARARGEGSPPAPLEGDKAT